MKSATLPSFWDAYHSLEKETRQRARKTYQLWAENPFHPSLRFKCIDVNENVWSVRITHSFRALGIWEGDTVTWFWIGNHDNYERQFS